jgi:hypothetical protein
MDDEDIQKAIRRGVACVRGGQSIGGTWLYSEIGATALAGLTLVECGVPADDPVVQNAAAAVRTSLPRLDTTYSLSLSILFLDRLGDKGDAPLIEALAKRLIAGQDRTGGWTYTCPIPGGDDEARRLETVAQRRNELVGRRDLPKVGPGAPGARGPGGTAEERRISPPPPPPGGGPGGGPGGAPPGAGWGNWLGGDNSNAQFAILGLWVAGRHGVNVEEALAKGEAHFRRSQNADAGWGYAYAAPESSASMTCAGLLGLAFGHGAAEVARERKGGQGRKRDVSDDPAIKNGLTALSTVIGRPVGNTRPGEIPKLGQAAGNAYYFLWSLDRVAVAYGLETIGGKDWYRWGAEILLSSQQPDGSWKGDYERGYADTCFALLFLRRSNLAQDLSAALRGRVRDPGKVTLRVEADPSALKKRMKGIELKGERPAQSPREASAAAARLSRELVRAAPAERERLLRSYRDRSGPNFTEALALAIPQLDGKEKKAAREALEERLTRMTAATLRDKLKDDDAEIRRAAARACAAKDDKQHIPDLIPLLEDPEPSVASSAHVALKSLTDQDFGPPADANREQRARAAAAWRAWWQKNRK